MKLRDRSLAPPRNFFTPGARPATLKKYETKMRRAGPLKEKFILQLLAPPPLPPLSPKLSYGCLSTAAAMPQTCQGSSCRSQSSPTSAPSIQLHAGLIATEQRERPRRQTLSESVWRRVQSVRFRRCVQSVRFRAIENAKCPISRGV